MGREVGGAKGDGMGSFAQKIRPDAGRAALAFVQARLRGAFRADLVVDLAGPFGTARWWRGFATCMALCVTSVLLAPPLPWAAQADHRPIESPPVPLRIPDTVLPPTPSTEEGLIAADQALAAALAKAPMGPSLPPMRFAGQAGASLYLSMRRTGLPFDVIKAYLQAVAPQINFDTDVTPDTRFDLVVDRVRDAAGKSRLGSLRYAGFATSQRQVHLIKDGPGVASDWVETASLGVSRPALLRPVSASRISSGFGFRLHPLLGYSRLHKGTDFAAEWGAPVHAMADGRVSRAGWSGGYGQMIVIAHSGDLGSGYAHLSSLAVASGERVRRGQVIGHVGSTGLSTGPHLHFEVYRNGVAVDPQGVNFATGPARSPQQIAALKAQVRAWQQMPVFSGPRPVVTALGPETAPQ